MKRYLIIFTLVGIVIGVTLGLLLAKPSEHVHGSSSHESSSDPAPEAASTATGSKGQTRTYYIAADEVKWDYAPSGKNLITGEEFDEQAKVFVAPGQDRIGKVYLKSQYQEYTDASFKTLKAIPAKWKHKGILGPVIEAEVGDTIVVVFKNNTAFPANMHPHGVFYEKNSEGALYDDGTSGADKKDDSVPPGGTVTYTWGVPERAGPGPMDPSSVIWMYHGHVDEPADTNAGLIGPIIITKRGMARPDGSPKDVDREFIALYTVFDENSSLYLSKNIQKFAGDIETVDPDDDDFIESNLMHSINGYVYGNLPLDAMTAHKGERVRWYVMAQGTEVDLHTPHWHGNTVVFNGMRTDVVNLLPMSMIVADMETDAVGTWFFHCHVNDHITAGMQARYRIDP
ncbi:MAG TPA: multicopper oxidase domain-containing protein [Anaerolineales bacterium]|nr:multicopper oxidase domain-containing protein [Anaerolineales bacterium]